MDSWNTESLQQAALLPRHVWAGETKPRLPYLMLKMVPLSPWRYSISRLVICGEVTISQISLFFFFLFFLLSYKHELKSRKCCYLGLVHSWRLFIMSCTLHYLNFFISGWKVCSSHRNYHMKKCEKRNRNWRGKTPSLTFPSNRALRTIKSKLQEQLQVCLPDSVILSWVLSFFFFFFLAPKLCFSATTSRSLGDFWGMLWVAVLRSGASLEMLILSSSFLHHFCSSSGKVQPNPPVCTPSQPA